MASSGESSNNDDWVNLPDQPHPNLQATAKSQVTSAGAANGEDRGHSNSWGLWSLVSWITTSGDTSVDRKDTSVDYVPDASSDMAASASQDPRKGPSLIKKAGGAVKKIISKSRIGEPADEQWELLGHEKEVSLALNPLVLCHVVYNMSCMWHAQYQSTESYKLQTYTHMWPSDFVKKL